ncbi:MAG: polyprenol monophosphomannose synthase [Candidatus Lindowbacteria bacterium]|nr:polyprenol monophosphomannose synthase [Candidatus Lindowbacteria bacterium]
MIVTMIPTYNECENIGELVKEIINLDCDIHVLVVDDNSPDGTHEIVQKLSDENPKVHLLLRKTERGRGSAGIAGFKKALEMGAEIIIEMDADFSHPTRYIPILLEAIKDVDVVFASRLVRGGGEVNRSLRRVTITEAANLLTRLVMNYPVHDCTAGYRLFKRQVLETIELDTLQAEGPAIVGEILYRVIRAGFRVREVPYVFQDRKFGTSNLGSGTLFNCLGWLAKLKWRQLTVDSKAFSDSRTYYKENPPEPSSKPWSTRS